MPVKEACIHHWLLESPDGETSKGTCKLCGTEQSFYNSPDWMRDEGNQWKKQATGTWAERLRVARLVKASSEKD